MRRIPVSVLLPTAIALTPCMISSPALADSPGLSVRPDGTLVYAGKPYRGIGINCFDLFLKRILTPSDTSHEQRLADLERFAIPFVRFNAGGFWPVNWKLYLEHPDEYFALLDDIVAAAEKHGIGLIPSLFWYLPAVPDIVGEPISAWGNPDSATHRFMNRYIEQIVGRYVRSPAIWAWEMGNEYNLMVAIHPQGGGGKIVPKFGTPKTRGPADKIIQTDLETVIKAFARQIRRHDPQRAILSGNSIPRWAADHLNRIGKWESDSREAFIANLIASNPDGVNTLSVHVYSQALDKRFGQDQVRYRALFDAIMAASARSKKPVFVGEFGADLKKLGPVESKGEILEQLTELEKANVPLAAVWVYDLRQQEGTYSIRSDNEYSWILSALRDANKRLQRSTGR